MVQAISARIYNPPVLPDYLKNVYDLKPIIGAPNDDEVKGVHAVLRMAHTVAHIPEIFDPQLTMNLTQHLFEIQMARYREKYPCGMFPEDMVHTPPTLPSHISVTLEPVHGVPSDEELQGVQKAIRAYEQMAIVPSMFDQKVGMELSQHLFNIQFARYMHDAPKAELGPKSKPRPKTRKSAQSSRSNLLVDPASDGSNEETVGPSNDVSAGQPVVSHGSTVQDQPRQPDNILGGTTNDCNHDQLSEKLIDALESIRRVLITTQQSSSRGIMHTRWVNNKGFYVEGHEIMNNEGVLPTSQGLPRIGRDGYGCKYDSLLSDNQLAQYLRFYGIGQDLIETGETPTIRSGQRRNAEVLLRNFVN